MRSWTQIILQDPSSPTISILTKFHDLILIIMIIVLRLITYSLLFLIKNNYSNRILKEAHKVELIWTIIPSLILMCIASPSLHLLYFIDELNQPILSIKTIGHQWYWRYEYRDFSNISYDSFILPDKTLATGEFRLLEVDNRIIVPIQTEIRLLVTASDVIHSWTVPALGVKADAIPGRLNQLSFSLKRRGVFYGQCSEICGINHSFMPIVLESINIASFIKWSKSYSSS